MRAAVMLCAPFLLLLPFISLVRLVGIASEDLDIAWGCSGGYAS